MVRRGVTALAAFRAHYPDGENLVVAHDTVRPHVRRFGELAVRFVGIAQLATLTELGLADAAAAAKPAPKPSRRRSATAPRPTAPPIAKRRRTS